MKKIILSLMLFSTVSFAQSKLDTVADEATKTLPTVEVVGQKFSQFDAVSSTNQPVWSTTRMFPSTRVYVMQTEGEATYEKWFDIRARRDGNTQVRMRDEIAIGLGNRLELDLYAHTVYDGPANDRKFDWRGFSWEVRYALADWGKIPGNPTLYFEHKLINGREGIEPKLLLGDRFGNSDYIWGVNLVYEANLGGTKAEQEREYAVTASTGKIINDNLMVGATAHYRYYDYDTYVKELYVGPAINYRIGKRGRISFEYAPRVTKEGYYDSRSFVIFAWKL